MKRILLISVSLLSTLFSFAQGAFETGDRIFSLGVGLGETYHYTGTDGYESTIKLPVIQLAYEQQAFDNNLSVGGVLAYTQSTYENDNWNYHTKRNTNSILALKVAYHFNELIGTIDELDVYGGMITGIERWSTKEISNTDAEISTVTVLPRFGLLAGARYYFKPQIAAYAEVGYSITWLTGGLTFKL